MMNVITANADGTTTIQVDFSDEGVNLQGTTKVKGTEKDALKYLPTFEGDLRKNFAEHFPVPEPEPEGEMI